jgi:hypothetical protein
MLYACTIFVVLTTYYQKSVAALTDNVADVYRSNSTFGAFRQTIRRRLSILKMIALSRPRSNPCNSTKLILITEYQFGNSGNNLIELTHGLYFSFILNATLVLPPWMSTILKPFDLTTLHQAYCFTTATNYPKSSVFMEIESEDSFFAFRLFKKPEYRSLLPPLNQETVLDISAHFLRVYSAFWSSPSEEFVSAAEWLIAHHLNSTLGYTSVHKRAMEGGCSKAFAPATILSDISPDEVPMNRPEWRGNLRRSHPLCNMAADFVINTMTLNHRHPSSSQIFVSFDGKGDVSDLKALGAVFSSSIDDPSAGNGNSLHKSVDRKFLDMFVAMHGDFFILNPRSTFSWQVYLIRVCLALESVPLLRNTDLFVQDSGLYKSMNRSGLWVSWLSVLEAHNRLTSDVNI